MDDWRSFDDVAETYERIHAPRFGVIAADLAAFVGIGDADRVLDVGTGTGVAAWAARERGARLVVGMDPSMGMLGVARHARPGLLLTAGEAVDLPFPDGSFDAVLANFVLPNLKNHRTALADIMRVLRPGGRLGMTAWGDNRDELERTWDELATSVVPGRMLQQMRETESPWFASFASRNFTEEALMRAEFRTVRSEEREYRFSYALDDYLEGREVFRSGRFVREMLGEGGWKDFKARARTTFADRFADPLQDTVSAILASAVKP